MRRAPFRDRFASWFVQSWIAGLLVRITSPIFTISQLRLAACVGIPVKWKHLTGRVSINVVDVEEGGRDGL